MSSLCVNMIVRNEGARIERCLRSVIPHICAAIIVDTGSTDDTISIMERIFTESKIPFEIHKRPFINFKQARNAALDCARNSSLWFDYILLTDADMELVVDDPECFRNLAGPSYDIIQQANTLVYHNRRVVSRYARGGYLGVTHEYLDVASTGCITGARFIDHADGSNRADKFKRDIALLLEDLRSDPDNERSWFYLAQSYRDDGQPAQAAQAYKRRIELAGWQEEVFDARMNYAHCLRNLGDEGGFVRELLMAYNYRPSRAEPLFELAKYFRERGDNRSSLIFSAAGMKIPRTSDVLFVNDYVYSTGLRDEFSICAFYDPASRDEGFKVANSIALDRAAPDWSREQAKRNIYYYLLPLSNYAPSFRAHRIDFTPPDGYIAMNPSIAASPDGVLRCVVRTVNYTMDEAGRYLIRDTNGEANGTNPIDTRNFLTQISPQDFSVHTASEIFWNRPPPAFDLVTGFEDMRLSIVGSDLVVNACVREENAQGWCRQVQGYVLNRPELPATINSWHTMLTHDQNEKNWMPFQRDQELNYVYRLGTVVTDRGKVVDETRPTLASDDISGGSQVIPFAGAYLAVVHESRYLPHAPHKRYYQHRFALMDANGALHKLSMPFVFHDKQIEFAAGLCWHPDHQRLLISYGVRDEEAWIAEVDWQEVLEMFV